MSSFRSICHIPIDQIKDARNGFAKSKPLGEGGEGKVYLTKVCIEGKNKMVAVKRLYPDRSNGVEKEIQTVPKIQHPNIVPLLGYCNESGQNILVYEYMKKGSLSDYVGHKRRLRLSWPQRMQISLGAARGLQHLHAATEEFPKGIIHRDVKPENILLDENFVAKISDLGMSMSSHSGQTKSSMATDLKGTRGFYAPEYLQCGHVTRKIDVYAFGVVLFQVLCRKMPWDRGFESYYRKSDEDLGLWAQKNVDSEIKGEIATDSLISFVDIINRCLKIDPAARPTMDDVVLDLEKVLKFQDLTMDNFVLDPDEMLEYQDPTMDIGLVLDLDKVPKCQDPPTMDIGLVWDLEKVPKSQDFTMDVDLVPDLDEVPKCQDPTTNIGLVRDKEYYSLSWSQRLHICFRDVALQQFHSAVEELTKGVIQNVWHMLHLKHPLPLPTSSLRRICAQKITSWRYICADSSPSIHLKGVTKGQVSSFLCAASRYAPTCYSQQLPFEGTPAWALPLVRPFT